MAPGYGARVVSLLDARSGRDWLAQGGFSNNVGDDAIYLDQEAVGWDECFPTVGRFDAPAPWNRRLRDHGELWGRPCKVTHRSADHVTTCFDHPLFAFTRTLRCSGREVSADYLLRNRSAEPLPFLWAAHILLAALPGERMSLGSHSPGETDYLVTSPKLQQKALNWLGPNPTLGFDLDTVQPIETGFAAKLYVAEMASCTARVGSRNGGLRISWSPPWTSLGIWLNYGGWPAAGVAHHIAFEPTTHPSAIFDRDTVLAQNDDLEWRVVLEVE